MAELRKFHGRRFVVAALVLILSAGFAHAGLNTWTNIGPPGGAVTRIVYGVTPGTVFALVGNGVYRSQDDGGTWQAVKTDFQSAPPRGLAVDPADAARVYLVAPEWPSLYVSTDGGATFQSSSTLPTAAVAAQRVVVSEDGRTLYVCGSNRLFRSVDRGQSWTETTPWSMTQGDVITSLGMEPGDPDTLYAAGTLGAQSILKRSSDGGQTWTVLYAVGSALTLDLAVSPADPAHLWAAREDGLLRSIDAGATWTSVRSGAVVTVVADPASVARALIATASGAVLRTIDGGSTWQDISNGLLAGQLTSLAMDPADSTRMLVGSLAGIWGTANLGVSWSARNTGLLASSVDEISADTATGRIYFDAADGLYQAAGTATPAAVDNAELHGLQGGNKGVQSLLAQPGRLFASLTSGLARSTDGGDSWSLQPIVPGGGTQQFLDLQSSPLTPQTILAGGMRSIYRSTDGGMVWTLAGSGLPTGAEIGRLRVAPSDGRVAYATPFTLNPGGGAISPLGLYRSIDGGLNWVLVGTDPVVGPLELLAIDPSAANTIYAGSVTSLRRSIDAGATWSSLTWNTAPGGGQPSALAVDPRDAQILYAANAERIARSVDGGATWETLRPSTALPRLLLQQLFVDPFHAATLLLSTYENGVQHLTIAPDLLLSGIGPGLAGFGMPVPHTFLVRNLGPFDATGVVVDLRWPASAQGVTLAPSSGSCTTATVTARCTLPIVRNGSTATIVLTAVPAAMGPFELEGNVTASEPDAVLANNALLMISDIGTRADLSVTATGTATATTGGAVNYTLTVRNTGPGTGAAATLTFQLASGLAPGTVTSSGGSCTMSTSGLVSCAFGDVANNATVTINVTATANTVGTFGATAQLTSSTADGSITDNIAAVNTAVTAPAPPTAPPAAPPASGGGGATTLAELLGLCLLAALALHRRRVCAAD